MKYCIGDIHGCSETFRKIIQLIFKEDEHPEIYLVGDLIDRGPNSKAVIDYIIDLINKGTKIHAVRGNHEEMFLDAYKNNYKIADTNWSFNGAEATIKSFVPQPDLNLIVKELIPEQYFHVLESLPYFIELEDYIIVHAGLNLNIKNPFTDFETMLWKRYEENMDQTYQKKKIIHGHTPIPFNQIKTNFLSVKSHINIDSGCVYTHHTNLGSLTALNLETYNLINVTNIDLDY